MKWMSTVIHALISKKTKRFIWGVGALALTACIENHYYMKTDVRQSDNVIEVSGQTNLPDQAQLLVSLMDPAETETQRQVVTQEFARVSQGAFVTMLKTTYPLPPKEYFVRIRFNPTAYDWSKGKVSAAVGPKGEKLSGPQVIQDKGVQLLQDIIKIKVNK